MQIALSKYPALTYRILRLRKVQELFEPDIIPAHPNRPEYQSKATAPPARFDKPTHANGIPVFDTRQQVSSGMDGNFMYDPNTKLPMSLPLANHDPVTNDFPKPGNIDPSNPLTKVPTPTAAIEDVQARTQLIVQHEPNTSEFLHVFHSSKQMLDDNKVLLNQDLTHGMGKFHMLIPDEFCVHIEKFAPNVFSTVENNDENNIRKRQTNYTLNFQSQREMEHLGHDLRKVIVKGLDSELIQFAHFVHCAMITMSGLRAMCLYALVENKHAGIIIGRKGQKMREIREKFGVRLEIEQSPFVGFEWGRRFSIRDAESITIARILSDLVKSITSIIVSEDVKARQSNFPKALRGPPVHYIPPPQSWKFNKFNENMKN